MHLCAECKEETDTSVRNLCPRCQDKPFIEGVIMATLDETVECWRCYARFITTPETYRAGGDGEFAGYECSQCGYVNEK